MREVLPSTSPTTRLSCAMTQRSCRVAVIRYFGRRGAAFRAALDGVFLTAFPADFFTTFLATFFGTLLGAALERLGDPIVAPAVIEALPVRTPFNRLAMADPISAGDRTVVMPAASSAANLAAAVP